MNWQPLILSLQVATCATLLATLFGVGLAIPLATRRFAGRELLDVLLTAPMILPPTVLGYYLLVLLGRQSWLGRWVESITGTPIVFTFRGAVIAALITSLPLVTKAARAALEGVDVTLLQTAHTLGASRWRALLTIHLPLARRGIAAGIMLGMARSLGDFGVTLMLAGNLPGETQTAALAIYDALQAGRDEEAAGLATVLTAAALLLLYAINKLIDRHER